MSSFGKRALASVAAPLATALLAAALLASPAQASAQDSVAGTFSAMFLASPDEDFGAALGADIYYPIEWFRIGGYLGVGAVPAGVDERNRVFMPLGVSVAAEAMDEQLGFALRIRGGVVGGATQDVKLTAGGFLGGSIELLFSVGVGAAIRVGLDVIGIFGDGETVLFAPSVGLSWRPPPPEAS